MCKQHVYVVDDDSSVRNLISFAVRTTGLSVKCFASAEAFLANYIPHAGGCVVLELKLPGKCGLELQKILAARGIEIPIVFLTRNVDVPMTVQAMRRGAVDVIEKPFDGNRLLHSIQLALEKDRLSGQNKKQRETLAENLEFLTEREKEVMELLIVGQHTKKIARTLGIAARTVDNHRAAVFQKMQVDNAVSLTRFVLTSRQ